MRRVRFLLILGLILYTLVRLLDKALKALAFNFDVPRPNAVQWDPTYNSRYEVETPAGDEEDYWVAACDMCGDDATWHGSEKTQPRVIDCCI